jgi:esterase/lipase
MNLIQRFPDANGFVLPGSKEACLMIHGFTSSPDLVRPLADHISDTFGWEVHAPLIARSRPDTHGTRSCEISKSGRILPNSN